MRDSKELSAKRREELADEIFRAAKGLRVMKLGARTVDLSVRRVTHLGLNRLEAWAAGSIVSTLRPNIAYIDSPDRNLRRFTKYVLEETTWKARVICSTGAEKKYPSVAAASIVAKVERDKEIERLKKRYGDFGSGYPSDSKTLYSLRKWRRTSVRLPSIVRLQWRTLSRI